MCSSWPDNSMSIKVYLILHETEERRDHHRDAPREDGRKLQHSREQISHASNDNK